MDTIFALATAEGRAGVSIIRVSGPEALGICSFFVGSIPNERRSVVRKFISAQGSIIDEILVLTFQGPYSFTGEDVVELHLHGSPAIVSAILKCLSQTKARLADPGEFTRRALENNKMDLIQIEALGDLICAETEAQRQQAMRNYDGQFTRQIEKWRSDLIKASALVEVTIDFVDEDVPEDVSPTVIRLLSHVEIEMRQELEGISAAERVRNGFEVAIVGSPNVGKSTLLNALAKRDAAITSNVAGTTRDVIEVQMDFSGLPVTILDTAGLRTTSDEVENEGVSRALYSS